MKYKSWFQTCFSEIIRKYKLQMEVISYEEVVLIGVDFILAFLMHHDDVSVFYIRRNEAEEIMRWDIDYYVAHAIIEEDRKGIIRGKTADERIRNIILILSRTFERCFTDILSGETEWMGDYMRTQDARKPQVPWKEEVVCAEQYI